MNFTMKSQRAALVKAMLDGQEISVMTAFKMLLMTNASREVNRSIIHPETGFGAIVVKKRVDFISTYGKKGYYFTYKLDRSESNKEAIKRMKDYLSSCEIKPMKNVIVNGKPRYIEQTLF